MKFLVLFAGLLLTFQCVADGSVDILGKNNDGWTIVVGESAHGLGVTIWKEGKDPASSVQSFDGFCKYEKDGFSCSADDRSPLSGTRYRARHVGSCDVNYEYDCVDGCKKNGRAPLILSQGYWEGDPDCGK